jgi:Family of unknown function (DUF6494)
LGVAGRGRGVYFRRGGGATGVAAKGGVGMNEDRFNMDIRKFLKIVGVTSQREIEKAARDALAKGVIGDHDHLTARITLSIREIGLEHVVEGEIGLS